MASVGQAEDGLLPTHPSVSWHEPTAVDPSRAPAGQAVARLQVLDVPLHPTGDAAEEIRRRRQGGLPQWPSDSPTG